VLSEGFPFLKNRGSLVGLYPTDAGLQLLLLTAGFEFKIFDKYHPSTVVQKHRFMRKLLHSLNDYIACACG